MSPFLLGTILFTVTLSACAQLALKWGVTQPEMASALRGSLVEAVVAAALSPLIWAGLLIYVVSVALWLWVLSKADLSVAYPFVGVSFLVTMAFGAFILQENVGPMRIAGTLLIAGGCILVGRSS